LIFLDSLKDTVQSLDIHLDPKNTSIIKKIVPKKSKLPGISDLQPRRVSWSDNKLAPLPGRGDRSSASLGDDIDLVLDDRQEVDTIGCTFSIWRLH
jgi:hypothetical protein